MKDSPTEQPPGDEGQLVRAVLRGQRESFDILVGRYQRQATATAYRLLGNLDDALEVVQESFLRAYRKLSSLSEPSRFGSWLIRIVVNQSLNLRRGRAVRKTFGLEVSGGQDEEASSASPNRADPAAQTPCELTSADELKDRIAAALDDLPDKQRQALVLFSIQNVPQKEVARILGISVEAVKWHVFSARKKLKERLREYL